MADDNPQYTSTTSTATSSSCAPIVINTTSLLSVMESASSEGVPHEIDVSIDVSKLVEAAAKSELQQPSSIGNTGTASTDVISIVSTAGAHSPYQQEGGGAVTTPTSASPRPIKHRPTFTEEQIQTMEAIFKHRQYLTPIERESVATAVGLTAQQVRVWFQNRRQKAKQFLAYKQHQQNSNTSTNDEDGEPSTTPNEGNNGTGQTDINSLLAKLQKPAVDPQLIQLIMPKPSTPLANQQSTGTASTKDNTDNIEQVKPDPEQSSTGGDSTHQLGVVSSNGTISINPQSLLCLTPLLVSSINKSLEDGNNTTGTATGTTIPVNAVQLLQSLSAATSKLSQTPPPTVKKDASTPTPLRAQSPVPVEQTITKPCDTTPIVPISNSNSTESPIPTDTEQLQETPSTAMVTSSATEILSNDVLQQILQASMEKAKTQTTPPATTPTSKLPPSLSLSLSSTAAERPSRKKRQVFSGHQIAEMEKHFEQSPYIDNKERETLAAQIGLMPDQVKVWFQNRRTKKSRLSWRQAKDSPEQ